MVLGRGRPVERGEEGACAAPTGVCSEPEAHGRGGILGMVFGGGRPVERGEEGVCAAPTGVCSEPEAHGRGGILSMVLGDGRPVEREREGGGGVCRADRRLPRAGGRLSGVYEEFYINTLIRLVLP